jgi:hypothetical protein
MKRLFLASILIFVAFTNVSFACSRFVFGVPICAEFAQADAVFLGKAIKVEDLTGKDDYPDNWKRVHFKVQQNFKGAENPTFTIITNDWRAACGLKIKKGETWIIYANSDEESKTFASNTGNKYTAKEYKEDLEILKAVSERKTNPTISGRLISFPDYIYKDEPVEITVEGNGSRLITTTNAEGAFKVSSLFAGNYKVKMTFPFKADFIANIQDLKYDNSKGTQTFLEYEVELKQGDCDYSFFEVYKNNKQ